MLWYLYKIELLERGCLRRRANTTSLSSYILITLWGNWLRYGDVMGLYFILVRRHRSSSRLLFPSGRGRAGGTRTAIQYRRNQCGSLSRLLGTWHTRNIESAGSGPTFPPEPTKTFIAILIYWNEQSSKLHSNIMPSTYYYCIQTNKIHLQFIKFRKQTVMYFFYRKTLSGPYEG